MHYICIIIILHLSESVKRIFLLLVFINFSILAYFISRPYSFYKSIAVRYIDSFDQLVINDSIGHDTLIINTIKFLPPRKSTVYTIKKNQRIERLLEGGGNCSNQSVAMGAILSGKKQRYQVVHLMPVPEFLEGSGHTVLQTIYKDSLAIFDLLGRSLLKKNNHSITYRDLDSLANENAILSIETNILNSNRDSVEQYYTHPFKTFIIGIVPDEEYNKFYSFNKWLPIVTQETRYTQAFYYAVACIFNKLPHIYVQKKDEKKLSSYPIYTVDRILSFTLIITTWLSLGVLIFTIIRKAVI